MKWLRNLEEKWKQEWWLKHAAQVAREYEGRQTDLISRLESELKLNVEKFELERDILLTKKREELAQVESEEKQVSFKLSDLHLRQVKLKESIAECDKEIANVKAICQQQITEERNKLLADLNAIDDERVAKENEFQVFKDELEIRSSKLVAKEKEMMEMENQANEFLALINSSNKAYQEEKKLKDQEFYVMQQEMAAKLQSFESERDEVYASLKLQIENGKVLESNVSRNFEELTKRNEELNGQIAACGLKKKELEESYQLDLASAKKKHQSELDALQHKLGIEVHKVNLLEEEVRYRQKTLDDRKQELVVADNELKSKIKVLEAKASPSAVLTESQTQLWSQAFSSAMNRSWDLMLPIMTENISKMKSKIEEEAVKQAIERLHAPNKK